MLHILLFRAFGDSINEKYYRFIITIIVDFIIKFNVKFIFDILHPLNRY